MNHNGPLENLLDVSRVEIAEELQKQQNDRLDKLWKNQCEQNQKIFEKFDQSMTLQNQNFCLRDQHAKQMEETRLYYEREINALKKQLADMKNIIQQSKLNENSVKSEIQKEFEIMSQTNIELSSRCDALESAKESLQDQLKQANITLNLSRDDLERKYNRLQENYDKLSTKYYKIKDESKMYRDRSKVQESVVEKTKKNERELESLIETLKRELEDSKVKCEVDKSLYNVTQQRLERLLLQNRDKDSIIEDLEIKVKSLEKTVKDVNINSAKAGLSEIRESIKRDKELLKRVLHDYDSLNEKHEKSREHILNLEGKLAESKGEGLSLRNRRIAERSSRKTWEQPASPTFTRYDLNDEKSFRRLGSINHKESSDLFRPAYDASGGYNKYGDAKRLSAGSKDEENSLAYNYCNQIYKRVYDKGGAEIDPIDRRAIMISAEKNFLELSEQRRRLESNLRKMCWSRMSEQDKEDKSFLESKLDEVIKELGRIREQLKADMVR
ncbi:ERC protein 2-like [Xenia sp. Carnegie-2017]|uniref:ERC protein 2-like n=1 Tax=Xenia sp. Carnegie-2017 TaxID=2897299 RepID=UPI001F04A93D|nr:ERC protein 2-like [Xenia sp. Carnegie-2017]